MRVTIQEAAFDAGEHLNRFTNGAKGAGAVVSFSGITRDIAEGLSEMQIEHYPGMTQKAISAIVDEAINRFSLTDAMVIHRFGKLYANDPIMFVATAAPHRVDAFHAAEFLMDYLKSRAPFWKKEISGATSKWVEAKHEDEDALSRWK